MLANSIIAQGNTIVNGFQKGVYQSIDTSNVSQVSFKNTLNFTLSNRLYKIEEINTTSTVKYIRCSTTNIYSQNFASVTLGVLNMSGEFVALSNTGTRSGSALNVSFSVTGTLFNANSFLIMRDNTNNDLYLVCGYYKGDTNKVQVSPLNYSGSGNISIRRLYDHSGSLTYPVGNGTKIGISYPAFRITTDYIQCSAETFGITVT